MQLCRCSFIVCFFILSFMTSGAHGNALPISSPFGWRIHPIYGDWRFHAGLDLAYEYGTPISVLFDGLVVMAGDYGDGYGGQVLVYHQSSDTYTRYAHCMTVFVLPGDFVAAGDTIAVVGSTGNSTGPHLHIEYIVPDGNGGYIYADPMILWQ